VAGFFGDGLADRRDDGRINLETKKSGFPSYRRHHHLPNGGTRLPPVVGIFR